jgi:hypothetical protein
MFIVKLLVGVFIFASINGLGFSREEVFAITRSAATLPYIWLCGIAFTVLPMTLGYVLIIFNIALQLSANLEIALIVSVFLLILLFFYARLAARESMLILATVLAFYFKLPYLIPLLAGMYFSVASIVPVTLGVFIWHYIPIIKTLMNTTTTAGLSLNEMPSSFAQLYTALYSSFMGNQEWIFTAFIFTMVILTVYAVSRLSIDFSKDLAIAMGGVLTIISFIIAAIVTGLDVGMVSVVFFTLLSMIILEIVRFFDVVLDYQRAERVQFEDEDNYYYVRVIPKVVLSKRKRVVRRIRNDYDD